MTKTALITGASSGLGEEFARQLAARSWNVILVARSKDVLEELAEELRKAHNIVATVIVLDLSVSNAAQILLEELRGAKVDLLVNNAGLGSFGLFQDTDPDRISQVMSVNIAALTNITRALLPQMITRKNGRILNVASTAAFQPGPLMNVYYASKAYVLHFSVALRNELQRTDISVSCLCPGPTKTGFEKNAHMAQSKLFHNSLLMDAKTVVATAIDGCLRGKPIIIPGWKNKLGAFGTRLITKSFAAKIARFVQSPH